ncbi:MAG TPA: hypothetical protein VMW73_07240 [Spirochaetia bacterium]|nr:hypothetical protein [Spirochaetia bacterium]
MVTIRKPQNRQRRIIFVCIVGVLCAFFGAVFQAYRYEELSLKVSTLENIQMDKIEQNKRAIAGIAVLSAPARIDALAQKQKDLVNNYPSNALLIGPPTAHSTVAGSVPQPSRPAIGGNPGAAP